MLMSYPVIRRSDDHFNRQLTINQFTNDHQGYCQEIIELLSKDYSTLGNKLRKSGQETVTKMIEYLSLLL